MQEYKTIEDLGDLNGKVVMLRADLNVPMNENFEVTNTARIDRTVPTIKKLMNKGAKVVVISHFGRPEGKSDMKNSLKHVAPELEKALGKKVIFVEDCIGEKVEKAVKNMKADEVLLLENLRFYDEFGSAYTTFNPKAGETITFYMYENEPVLPKLDSDLTVIPVPTVTATGDADGSGELDILDIITVNKAILGKENLSEDRISYVDFNGNGVPDADDALTMLKMLVGLI